MKLIEISLENFRQFYEEQNIKFSDGDKNITIIFGENGKGKTGIFRALIFGLFGDRYLAQDNTKDKIHLVNFNKIEENKGIPIFATVKVEFEHKNIKYRIERQAVGLKLGSEIDEKIIDAKLYITDEDGNFSPEAIEDQEEVKAVINNILDEKIKDFFLFDAERIETLAKTDVHVKQEVKSVIVKLLQIDKLDKGITILRNLHNKENKRIVQKSSNIDLKNKECEIEDIKKDVEKLMEKLEIKNDNITACTKEIEETENKLAENEEIRALQAEVKAVKEKKNDKMQALKYLKEALKSEHFNNGHKLLMKDSYLGTKAYINQILVDKKDLIPIEVIEKSLNEMTCDCCKTNLSEIKEAYENVLKLKNNYKRSEMTPLITEINGTIHEFNDRKDEMLKNIEKKLKDIRFVKDEIDGLNKQLDRYKEKIQDCSKSEENLNQLEKNLDSKKVTLKNLQDDVTRLTFELENKEKDIERLKREYERLIEKDSNLKYEHKRLAYINDLKSSFERIFNEYSDDMREKLMRETTEIFRTLIDIKDKSLIESIKINDKYEIELYNWLGTKMTQDISQGQRQVVALSFITALAKVAAGSTENIDFPLFMDTPFGRISGKNRDNLIENIPNLTSQWILLLTDTEFSVSEEIKFKSTEKLGRWYRLDQIKPGYTKIVEIDLSENMATRR